MNIDFTSLNNEELVKVGNEIINRYEQEKALGAYDKTVQGKDIQALEKHLQRTIIGTTGGMETSLRVKNILASDFGIRDKTETKIKSLYDLEQEKNALNIRPLEYRNVYDN